MPRMKYSALKPIFHAILLSTAATLVSVPVAAKDSQKELSEAENSWYRAQLGLAGRDPGLQPATDPVGEAVLTWRRLQQPGVRSFSEISSFLLTNPGWPNESDMRRAAEASLSLDSFAPDETLRYFKRFPPLTAGGHLRHAMALLGAGQKDAAKAALRTAWSAGRLNAQEEMRAMALLPDALATADHDARMERLLWSGDFAGAARVLPMTSPAKRQTFDARLAMRTNAVDAAMKMAAVDSEAQNDAGYLADKARWLRNTGQTAQAQSMLAAPRKLAAPPLNAEAWYEILLKEAREAAKIGDHRAAFAIASQVNDGVAAGTNIRTADAGIRDDYTSLTWLAGTTAFRKLNQPNRASEMFSLYANAARSPQTIAKGLYWAGRAAEKDGQKSAATQFFEAAAVYGEHFYGQLAIERLGRTQPMPRPDKKIELSQAQIRGFEDQTLVRAARALGELGAYRDQSLFVRAISNNANSDAEFYLATKLSEAIDRPDLGVMAGRAWRTSGLLDSYTPTAFPIIKVPDGHQDNWTMIHAITRQESQFDQYAVSRAKAQGLMQLMPATARETAGKIGLPYDFSALTSDKAYNIKLGSTYIQRMLSYYGGSYPLAVAAYNAGPGNVNKWLAANGDPRTGSIDIVDWIEAIPIEETRSYVQRVLENAVVYDALDPKGGGKPQRNHLSQYLGKKTPG